MVSLCVSRSQQIWLPIDYLGELSGIRKKKKEREIRIQGIHAKSPWSCLTLCDHIDYSPPAPLSMEFFRQEHSSGFSCPPPGEFTDLWIDPESLCFLHWQMDTLPLAPSGGPGYSKAINYAVKKWLRIYSLFVLKKIFYRSFLPKNQSSQFTLAGKDMHS